MATSVSHRKVATSEVVACAPVRYCYWKPYNVVQFEHCRSYHCMMHAYLLETTFTIRTSGFEFFVHFQITNFWLLTHWKCLRDKHNRTAVKIIRCANVSGAHLREDFIIYRRRIVGRHRHTVLIVQRRARLTIVPLYHGRGPPPPGGGK